ncbi:UNVERIFIED_CONTAM: hypothetical protein RF648_21620 [Kocuria sp. CPCC 205274]
MTTDKKSMNKQFKTCQITAEQYERLREIQTAIKNDPKYHGFIPTIHHLSRVMIDKGIDQWEAFEAAHKHE